MSWFLLALFAPALWASTNFFDKYLVEKYFHGSGAGALMIFSALVGIIVLPIVVIVEPGVLSTDVSSAAAIIPLGWIYLCGIIPYLYALQKGDVTVVVPMWQLIPVISLFLEWAFLKEEFTSTQLLGGGLIVCGAIVLSLEMLEDRKFSFRWSSLLLMLLSSTFFAVSFLLFKVRAVDTDFATTVFWEYVGFILFGIFLLIFVSSYRKQFVSVLKSNKVHVLSLNGVNEILNVSGKLVFNSVSMLVPVTLVWVAVGFQPLFTLIYGVALTLMWPKVFHESIGRAHMVQKSSSIVVMCFGAVVLQLA